VIDETPDSSTQPKDLSDSSSNTWTNEAFSTVQHHRGPGKVPTHSCRKQVYYGISTQLKNAYGQEEILHNNLWNWDTSVQALMWQYSRAIHVKLVTQSDIFTKNTHILNTDLT